MRVLIIGGTGNISWSITSQLLSRGADVTLFKRTPDIPAELVGIHVINGDRTETKDFREKISDIGPFDCVIDMVCYEAAEARTSVELFRDRTKQFIFCSAVDVYTKTPLSYPVSEEHGRIDALPSFPYAFKKVECEKILWQAHSRGDFLLTVFRPAFTYNKSWSPGIHSFGGQTYHLDRLRKGKPILMHGDGTSIWVATYRDDVATAFVNAISNTVAYGQAFNVTGDEWMTHNFMWRTIARTLDAPEPDFLYIPTDLLGKLAPSEAKWCLENFRFNNIFDNSKAKRDLGFRYTVSFAEGARRCLDYLQRHNLIESCENYPFYDQIVGKWQKERTRLIEESGQ